MVEVVVSKSGSCEPRSAKPRATGLFVPSPKVREAAAVAISKRSASRRAAWVIDNISGNKWSYYQFGMVRGDRQLFSSLKGVNHSLLSSTDIEQVNKILGFSVFNNINTPLKLSFQ